MRQYRATRREQGSGRLARLRHVTELVRATAVVATIVVLAGTLPAGAHEVVGVTGDTSTAHQWGDLWGYPNAGPPPGSEFLTTSGCANNATSCVFYPELTEAERVYYGTQEWKWVVEQVVYRYGSSAPYSWCSAVQPTLEKVTNSTSSTHQTATQYVKQNYRRSTDNTVQTASLTINNSSYAAGQRLSATFASATNCPDGVGYNGIVSGQYVRWVTQYWAYGLNDPGMPDPPPFVAAEQLYGSGKAGFTKPSTVRRSDPVDTATGALIYDAVDIAEPGPGVALRFERAYTSADTATGPMGVGWTHSYNATLTSSSSGAVVRTEEGSQLRYTLSSGSYLPAGGVTAALTTTATGWKLTRTDQVAYHFDSAGKLTSIVDRSGLGVTLSYTNSQVSGVVDAVGRTASLTYDTSTGKLSKVELGDGRHVDYGYTAGRLTSVTDVRGKTTTYTYDTGARLEREVDPNGHIVFRNVYGTDGRVIEQYDSLNNRTTFAWNPTLETSTMTDAAGATWVDVYDNNILVESEEPAGTASVTFDRQINPTSGVDARGKTWAATYDSRGNVLTKTAPAPLSYVESWTYDSRNNPLTYTDGRNNTTSYTYDTSGRLLTETAPGGATTTYTYNGLGLVATVTDANNHTTTYGYDSLGNRTSITTPEGAITTYTYDTAGRVLTVVEPRGNEAGANPAHYTTTFTYDSAGHVLTETDALGRTTTHTYDDAGNRVTTTDRANGVTTFSYNAANELLSTTAPDGTAASTSYDDRGLVASTTSAEGHVTTYTYDDAGRVLTKVDPRGNAPGGNAAAFTWTYAYDANGNQTSVTDPLGHASTTTYDALNRRSTVTDANGHATSFTYDANSNVLTTTDALNATTTNVYDVRNRLTSSVDSLNKTTTYTYDNVGNRLSVTTPRGAITTFVYDDDNRLVSEVDPLGNAAGGTPAQHTTSYAYDTAGHRVSVSDPLGRDTAMTYDRAGRHTTTTDANNHTTTYDYDTLGRLASVTGPDGAVTTYGYDPVGNLTSRTDDNNHTTTYTYDDDGRLTTATDALGRTWTYGYDPAGNRTSTTDAIANAAVNPALGMTTMTYDALNRVTAIDYSDTTADVTFAYDNVGNRTTMTDGAGTETRAYDNADRLTSVTRGTDVFSYGYDTNGRLTQRTYPNGTTTALTYNDDGQLTTVVSGSATTTYTYDIAGRLTATSLPNGYTANRTWDAASQLVSLTNAKGGVTLSSFTYTRDDVGNPTQITTPSSTETFAYDNADRLTSSCRATSCTPGSLPLTTWTYDGVGNRLTQTAGLVQTSYAYDAADQLTSSTTAGIPTTNTYDANGRQTTAGATTYTWDLAGRLTTTATGLLGATTYTYDGDSKRTSTSTSQSTTTYLWDPNGPLSEIAEEHDSNGAARSYIYGLDRIAMLTGGNAHYYLTDELGSVANLTSATGSTEWTHSYDPFGGARSTTKNDLLAPDNTMRFTGQKLDPTGLYHLRARQYEPTAGRFLSVDPLAHPVGDPFVAPYVYVENRPAVLVDPSGEQGRKRGAVGGLVGPQTAAPKTGWGAALGAAVTLGWRAGRALREHVESPRRFRTAVADGRTTDGCDAHHIVAVNDRRAVDSRAILKSRGISVHDPRNGALISRTGHHRLHTNEYHRMVFRRLQNQYPNVDFTLAEIQFELETDHPCPQ